MKRLPLLLLLTVAAACNKPTEGECRKALANMQHLMGTENVRDPAALEGEVRRCKGGSKKKAVDCAMKAATLDDLRHCEFYKIPANAPGVGGNDGSGHAGATNAATGGGSMGDQGTMPLPPGAPGSVAPGAPGGVPAGAPQPPAGGTTGGPATSGGAATTGGPATGGGSGATAAGADVTNAGANVGSAGANVGSAGAQVGSAGANIR